MLSGILPVMGGRDEEHRKCRRIAITTQVQQLCMEDRVGFVDMWLNCVVRNYFFMRDVLHLTGRVLQFLGVSLSLLSTTAQVQ